MTRRVFVVLLLWGASAGAQIPTPAVPIAVEVLVLPAVGDPLTIAAVGTRTTAIAATSANCNQVTLAVGPTPLINPTLAEVDDPFTAARKCRVAMPVNLPDGTGYRSVAIFKHAPPTADSARSLLGVPPFDIAGILVPRAAPTGVAVRP